MPARGGQSGLLPLAVTPGVDALCQYVIMSVGVTFCPLSIRSCIQGADGTGSVHRCRFFFRLPVVPLVVGSQGTSPERAQRADTGGPARVCSAAAGAGAKRTGQTICARAVRVPAEFGQLDSDAGHSVPVALNARTGGRQTPLPADSEQPQSASRLRRLM